MESYFDDVTSEVMVNVTDLYDEDLRKVTTELAGEYSWTGVEYKDVIEEDGKFSQWMFLLGATERTSST